MLEWAAHTSGEVSGEVKNFQNFTFLKVHDAGHMVPTDQPESALDMIMEFIYTKKITGKPIPIPEVDPMPEEDTQNKEQIYHIPKLRKQLESVSP